MIRAIADTRNRASKRGKSAGDGEAGQERERDQCMGSESRSNRGFLWYTTGMEITLNLPEDIAQGLQAKWKDLPRAVLESLALEAYRSGALTTAQGRRLLGFETRYEVDGFLKQHGVDLNYGVEDLRRDAEVSGEFSSRR